MGDKRTIGFIRNVYRYFTKVRPAEKRAIRELVGTDKYGNKYYHIPRDRSSGGRDERIIEPPQVYYDKQDNVTKYGIDMDIPVEWTLWLRGTRKYPPTPEEIERNEINKIKMAEKVRRLEMAEAEERLRLGENTEGTKDSAMSITKDVKGSPHNPDKVPFPTYGDVFEAKPGVHKEPND